jgi:hypothetical protein
VIGSQIGVGSDPADVMVTQDERYETSEPDGDGHNDTIVNIRADWTRWD